MAALRKEASAEIGSAADQRRRPAGARVETAAVQFVRMERTASRMPSLTSGAAVTIRRRNEDRYVERQRDSRSPSAVRGVGALRTAGRRLSAGDQGHAGAGAGERLR